MNYLGIYIYMSRAFPFRVEVIYTNNILYMHHPKLKSEKIFITSRNNLGDFYHVAVKSCF